MSADRGRQWTRLTLIEGSDGKMPWAAPKVGLLVGLPLLVFGAGLGTWWGVRHIEDTLVDDARSDLTAAGIDHSGLDIDFDYRDGDARGVLPIGITAAAVESSVDNGLLRELVVSATETDPVIELGSTDVSATLENGRILLSGTVLDESQRERLVAAAAEAVGADNVDDQLIVSGLDAAVDGADARVGSLAAALATFGGAASASASLSDTSFDVQLATVDPAVAAEAQAAADAAAGEITSSIEVAETGPIEVTATVGSGAVVLTGTVLDETHREALVTTATEAFGAGNVDDQLTVTGLASAIAGDPDERVDALARAFGALAGTESATANLTDQALAIRAVSGGPENADALEGLIAGISAVRITVEFGPASTEGEIDGEIAALGAEFDALADEIREAVVFSSGLTTLSTEAQATLDKAFAAINRYTLPVVRVGGHTDDVGSDVLNRELSAGRAEAVVAYLVSQGVPTDRVEAVGFGEDEPIATNDTAEGRALNRRVELTALPDF